MYLRFLWSSTYLGSILLVPISKGSQNAVFFVFWGRGFAVISGALSWTHDFTRINSLDS